MGKTFVRSTNIEDGGVKRADLNTATSGDAVTTKIVQGTGISLSSSGADSGTGDVTVGIDSTVTTLTGAQTLTNKRFTPRVTTIASNATWSPSADTDDEYVITAQAVAVTTISNPSGTPVDGQTLIIRVKDNSTARALNWTGTQWRASSDLALPTTTTLGKTMYLGFIWNATDSKWDLLAKLDNF
jgi:hypothetical protein